MKGRRCCFFVTAEMQPLLAEFPFLDPIPVFHFSKTQPSFFQFIYAINSLTSVFFSIQSCRLGGENPSCSRKCLRQNFHGRIFTSSLDIQTWISWASDIEIKRFKNSNSSMRVGLQLSRRIQGEIKSFYITESGRNLVGKKNGFLIWFKNWRMPSMPIWLRV